MHWCGLVIIHIQHKVKLYTRTRCIFTANNNTDVFSSPVSTPHAPPPSQSTPRPYSQSQQMSHHLSLPTAPQTPSSAYTRPIQFLPPNQSSSRSQIRNSNMLTTSLPFTSGQPYPSGSSTSSTSQQFSQSVQLVYGMPVISTPSFSSGGTPQPYHGPFSMPSYRSPYPPPRNQQLP